MSTARAARPRPRASHGSTDVGRAAGRSTSNMLLAAGTDRGRRPTTPGPRRSTPTDAAASEPWVASTPVVAAGQRPRPAPRRWPAPRPRARRRARPRPRCRCAASRRTNDAPMPSSSDVDGQHGDVAAPDQRLADRGPASRRTVTVALVGQRVDRARRASDRPRSGRPGAAATAIRLGRGRRPTAHNHHSGPDVGWRSTMRRQATTSRPGRARGRASAPAVSRTSIR